MMKLMTLNINHHSDSHGPWASRRGRIAEAIRRHAPDIIAFQAVRGGSLREPAPRQAWEVAWEAGGYPHAAYAPGDSLPDGESLGSAFLSRFPMERAEGLPLGLAEGQSEDSSGRALLSGLFRTPWGPLRVFNAHFSWVPAQALINVEQALSYMSETGKEPALLAGDMNMPPDSLAMARLRSAGWVDVWSRLRPDDPGPTFDAKSPDRRIDYVWANPPLVERLEGIDLVMESKGGHWLSDHRGLVVTLSVEKEGVPCGSPKGR
jgi:endonuclease/exonuclease/phosphatase family metal-dependent hydrolase